MKKKGFTLIELLAVIVVLAIIALITTPMIMNVIEKAKKGALEDSAYGLIDSAGMYYTNNMLDGSIEKTTFTFADGKQTSQQKLQYKGKVEKGSLMLFSDGKTAVCIENGKYAAVKNVNEKMVVIKTGICEFNQETNMYETITPEKEKIEELENTLAQKEKELKELKSIGNATAEEILKDKTALVQGIEIKGNMANNGNLDWSPSEKTSYTLPAGYYSGGTISTESAYEAGYTKGLGIKAKANIIFEHTSGKTTWTCPLTGYYEIYVYGAQGESTGTAGSMRGSTALIEEGTVITVVVGNRPSGSSGPTTSDEGASNSDSQRNKYTTVSTIDGYETGRRVIVEEYWGSSSRQVASGYQYRGYPDGNYGGIHVEVNDSKSGGAACFGYGGGGSSYMMIGDTKIISAAGGAGGSCYKDSSVSYPASASGGSGGGTTTLNNATGVTWQTDILNESQSNVKTQNGKITIALVSV